MRDNIFQSVKNCVKVKYKNIFMNKPKTVDEYITLFPEPIQNLLQQIRSTIHKAAPDALETIKYGMPTYTIHGNLVHFAAFKNHIGFYSLPSGTKDFDSEISVYKIGKGSIQFPIELPMPIELITKIVKFRVKENIEKEANKKRKINSRFKTYD